MKIYNHKKQQGAALVVSLIMLTVLTLLSVSNMSSSTLDLKMATNSRASYNSFQAAYSAIDETMVDGILDFTDLTQQANSYTYKTGTDKDGNDITASVAVTVTAGQIVSGVALLGESLGEGGANFILRDIQVVGTSGTSTSVQIQGTSKRAASGGSI